MARPKHEHPTPGELEALKLLWERGPLTGREVMEVLNRRRPRAYTSVMSLLNTMTDKQLLTRRSHGRAFIYGAKVKREKTLGRMIRDLLGRAFEGSPSALVAQLLDQANPTQQELDKIRQMIENYGKQQGGK